MRTLLCSLVIAFTCSTFAAEPPSAVAGPEDAARRDEQGVALPPDVIRRLGSGLFRCDTMSNRPPFLSPDGHTVYVNTSSELLAVDSQTGQQRFAHSFGGNVEAVSKPEGVYLEVTQGPQAGLFELLEHALAAGMTYTATLG